MTDAPPAFDGLILDLDGTLADTMPSHYVAWRRALEPHGITYEEPLFYEWGGKPDRKIAADLAAAQGRSIDVGAVAEAKRRAYLELGPDHVVALPATRRLAEACREVIPMAIATGGRRNIAEQILSTLGMLEWFDAVVTADDVTEHKPAPETYVRAAEAIGVLPHRCLAVEDTALGMQAADDAGCTVIHVDHLPNDPWPLLWGEAAA